MEHLTLFFVLVGGLVNVARSDGTDQFTKPCGSTSPIDEACVRQYFAEHAQCAVIDDPDDEPVVRPTITHRLPVINTTIVDSNTTLGNIRGPIEAFYTQPEALVLAVRLINTTYMSDAVSVLLDRKAQSPKVITVPMNATYPEVILTATIPWTQEGQELSAKSVQDALITSFFLSTDLSLTMGAELTENSDPLVRDVLASMVTNQLIVLEELFIPEGRSRMLAYLQKYICDFDVPIN